MAGIRGNQAYVALAKQSVKGTPVTAFTDAFFLTSGNVGPTRDTDQLQETDDSVDAGDTYITQTSGGGNPEGYVRDSIFHHVLEAAFGALASDAGPTNFTHDITLASALPYYTFGKMVGATLYEQVEDAYVNELTVSADAGQPLTFGLDIVGRATTRLAAEWSTPAPPARAAGAVYNFNDAAVTLSGGATSLISSFELTLSNNVSRQQTDDSVPYDVTRGLRTASLAFDLIFESLDDYNEFHYGSAAGTVQTSEVFTTDASFTFTKGANNAVSFTFPSLAIEEFPVEPDASGDPIVVPVRARAQRDPAGLVSAQVKNQVAT